MSSRNGSQPPPPPLPERSINGYAVSQKSLNDKSSSDSDSDDDAPLASLVPPRRPGSAMSSYSNLHSRSTGNVTTRSNTGGPKPLIDINDLTGPKRGITAPIEKNSAGFTEGRTLLSLQNKGSYSSSPLVESPVSPTTEDPSVSNFLLTRKEPPVKFVSPPGSPAKELQQFISRGDPSPLRKTSDPESPSRSSSSEVRRDPITERLTKVVKKNISMTASMTKSHQSEVTDTKVVSMPETRTSSGEDTSDRSSHQQHTQKPLDSSHPPRQAEMPHFKTTRKEEPSPVDPELAQLLGTAGIKFITRDGDSSDDSTDNSESDEDEDEIKPAENYSKDRIVPIPVQQRSPPPAFSVTSRPPLTRGLNGKSSTSSSRSEVKSTTSVDVSAPRPRSTTLTNTSSTFAARKSFTMDSVVAPAPRASTPSSPMLTSKTKSDVNANTNVQVEHANTSRPPINQRQRSSTMLTGVPLASQMPKPFNAPQKPFAMRRNSPASSTGDSSNGRTPLTPLDGSDITEPNENQVQHHSNRHEKRRSVSFGDDLGDLKPPSRSHFKETSRSGSEAGDASNEEDREHRRRERRRSEAKASIEVRTISYRY